jgi:hypothetical protein
MRIVSSRVTILYIGILPPINGPLRGLSEEGG